MACLHRLLAVFFVALSVWSPVPSSAAIPPVQSYTDFTNGYTSLHFSTPDGACTDFANLVGTNNAPLTVASSGPEAGSWVDWTAQPIQNCLVTLSNGQIRRAPISSNGLPVGSCPANSTLSGGSCVCTPPAVEDSTHTSCVVPDPLKDFCKQHADAHNTFKMAGSSPAGSGIPASSCYVPDPPFPDSPTKGCSAAIGNAVAVPGDNGSISWAGTGTFDGSTCESSPPPPDKPKASDDDCPGGFKGVVNGVSRCVPAEPDKGIDGVKSSSGTDSNGVKTDVKEVTKCEGSNCTTTTTTTTTTPASGGGAPVVTTTTKSETKDIVDKCKQDPTNQVCQKTQGGIGKGISDSSCQTNPSATGCGGSGAPVGDLYTKKDKTFGQALKKFGDDIRATALGSGVANFFTVGGGGTCPRVSGSIPFINKVIVIDTFCTEMAAAMFSVIRAVLFMLATWMAFRIAFGNE